MFYPLKVCSWAPLLLFLDHYYVIQYIASCIYLWCFEYLFDFLKELLRVYACSAWQDASVRVIIFLLLYILLLYKYKEFGNSFSVYVLPSLSIPNLIITDTAGLRSLFCYIQVKKIGSASPFTFHVFLWVVIWSLLLVFGHTHCFMTFF